eukprot:gene18193-21672_t
MASEQPGHLDYLEETAAFPDELSVFCGTWNMGNQAPKESVADWLEIARGFKKQAQKSTGTGGAAAGATAGMMMGAVVTFPVPMVGAAIGGTMGAWVFFGPEYSIIVKEELLQVMGAEFVHVGAVVCIMMRLCLLVKNELKEFVTETDVKYEGTGVGHMLGNKGGIGARIVIGGTSFCFLSCHLAAHQEKWEDRNEDIREIMRGIRVGEGKLKELDFTLSTMHTFWMGDMNYRLDIPGHSDQYEKAWENCVQLIEQKNYPELLRYDQLLGMRRSGLVLNAFE